MVVAGGILLVRGVGLAGGGFETAPTGGLGVWRGFDVVVAYQVSWILMFADYSRFTASPSRSAVASFLALAATSLWFMPIGLVAARAAGSTDPGAMVQALGVGWAGAVVLVLGTLTTNFVNVYLSALAWKSLIPDVSPRLTVWATGAVGTGLGLLSRVWLERYEGFMLVLGGLLVPLGGVLLARFFTLPVSHDPAPLYGPRPAPPAYVAAGLVAWAAGAAVYYAAGDVGGTLPAVLTAGALYRLLARSSRSPLRMTSSDAPMSAATADQREP
jgi:purine-cytosine permease-like protein